MSTNGPAILSSALMARKGSAMPTGYTPVPAQDLDSARRANEPARETADRPRPARVVPLAPAGGSQPCEPGVGGAESQRPDSARRRVSVRLDRERHLKLKLSAAHLQQSAQDIITEALDRYLEQISPEVLRNDCPCLGIADPAVPRGGSAD